ncbi:MAG: AMP-binding protein [Chthoniobacteraceae bacterium]|nr:AMP-binding protein [Chthoniobacteraceae bacterium]
MPRKSKLLNIAEHLVRAVYRLHVRGIGDLPPGGCLLVPNHVSWVDAILLQAACPRPIRFLVYEPIYRNLFLHPVFRLLGAIPISSRKAKDALRKATACIQAGEIVCIFPEGELSRTGMLLRLRRGYELIAHAAECPIVPVWLDQLWGSIFSFQGGRFFRKLPRRIPYPVTVHFGEAMAHDRAGIALLRQRMLELGEAAYQQRPLLHGHLALACLRGLKHHQFEIVVVDGMDGSRMSRGMVLAAAVVLSRQIAARCPLKRIAIMLPPGRAAVIANLAVMLADKVPVNLNFTAGGAAMASAIRTGGMEDLVTAGPVLKRFGDLPLPPHLLLLEEILPPLRPRILFWRAVVAVTPWRLLARILRIPRQGDEKEAAVLFTSGSGGDPKGVVLTHRNLLANVSQFAELLNLSPSDSILASLPFFHSFGCTVTLWYPLIERIKMVTYPNPLDAEKTAELIHKHKITLIVATPTFLRGYLRKARPEQLASASLVVAGAEKLPRDVANAFREKFGKEVLEGYGLTETSPVVSVNLPEPPKSKADDEVQPSSRPGSVGKLAPGIAAQIRDPETGRILSCHETGMLWVKGANIFEGYLNDPGRTAEVLQDKWFKTGDLARFDEDGFLYIEGRVARFSKIGGEMVPHEALEVKIQEALGTGNEDTRSLCIVGIPNAAKGEAIVLLSTVEIDLGALRSQLLERGVPALWIPKIVKRVPLIPVMANGKLDLQACKAAAMERR